MISGATEGKEEGVEDEGGPDEGREYCDRLGRLLAVSLAEGECFFLAGISEYRWMRGL